MALPLPRFILLLAPVTIFLVGCESDSFPCPEFGSALADSWSTALNPGDTVNFISDLGNNATLNLQSRDDSSAYTETLRPGRDEGTCFSESERRFIFDGSDTALLVTILQNFGEDGVHRFGDTFRMSLEPESPVRETLGYNYVFSLSEQDKDLFPTFYNPDQDDGTPQASRLINDFESGGQIYSLAAERNFVNVTSVQNAVADPNSLASIVRVVVAQGGGLVQFELLNGEVFSRM